MPKAKDSSCSIPVLSSSVLADILKYKERMGSKGGGAPGFSES